MQEQTTRLGLPYILPSQAQKHVPHNEALDALDAMVQLVLATIESTPPVDPADGVCYGIGTAPVGPWHARGGAIAQWRDGGWHFLQPHEGWLAWSTLEQRLYVHDGAHWQPFALQGPVPSLGINATADETNRLSVSAPASIFSHDGADHRMKINKAAGGDTASLIFQSGWAGKAELGLAGSDTFSVRVTDTVGAWHTALSIAGNGHVATPRRPAVRAWMNVTMTPATGTLTGFTNMDVSTGNFTLGAAVPSGFGNRLVVPATSHYLACLSAVPTSASPFQVGVMVNGTQIVLGTGAQSGTPTGRKASATAIIALAEGDWVALHHQGTANMEFGFDKTELSLVALI